MALARLALKNLQQRVLASPSCAYSLLGEGICERSVGGVQRQRWGNEIVRRFTTTASDKVAGEKTSDGKDVAVSEAKKKSKLFPRKQRRRWLWKNDDPNSVPALYEFFPSGLGNALMQATDNINKLFENLNITPWSLSGRIKAKDNYYKLQYEVPGLAKEDLKITVDDGVLRIKGEHKEEKEEDSDDEYWSSRSYGYYNTSVFLPEDAKVDEIKAELKDGVLSITIPRAEMPKKEVKEINVH
ncbi:26.5 kDa heat shock protein, mitochondrial [Quercus suber]|nr:26.5 kDa heat shock protein, mitochondrial-like [Quercus suber]